MERIQLKAQSREDVGKKFTKGLRKVGLVPAVVYKGGKKTTHLKINEKDLFNALHTKAGENVLINLKIDDTEKERSKDRMVIIKDIQHHPIKEQILHVDFQEILLTEKLTVDVPIVVKGEAEGVVKEGGILEQVIWEVKVECLPTDIPEKIEIDVTHMKVGDSILVKNLGIPSGVKILADAEQTVVSLVPPHVEKPVEAVEEIAEPELIREKKEEELEEEPEKAQPEAKKEEKKEEKEGKK